MPSITRARSRRRAATALLCATLAAACGGDRITRPDPDRVEIVTSDIAHFWAAYDAGGKNGTIAPFQGEYLDRASPGLRDFAAKKGVTASSLAQMVTSYPRYFAAVRVPMMRLATDTTATDSVRAALTRLREIYPTAHLAPVTLLVGRFNTGGTIDYSGILIGAEFYADAATPRDELGSFERTNVHGIDSLAYIVTHESVHVQQSYAGSVHASGATLLEQAFLEGSADFVGELASHGNINAWLQPWALPREAQLWSEFQLAMDGTDWSQWLYNQNTATADRPGDLGYFIGYRIAKAYYDAQSDKRAAVREIIGARDVKAFLAKSGYDPQ
jgi:hypothetical protein